MRRGMSPREACLDALRRVVRNFNDDRKKLAEVSLYFYALRKDGEHGAAALWSRVDRDGRMQAPRYVVNDGGASRFADAAYLLERK